MDDISRGAEVSLQTAREFDEDTMRVLGPQVEFSGRYEIGQRHADLVLVFLTTGNRSQNQGRSQFLLPCG